MTQRILLVEDDPVSRDLLAALLATRGYVVDTADDGFSALRMAQDERYDLVFVDYHLPEMDGYALARLMRTLGETSQAGMKMVAITADKFGLAARRGVDSIFDRVVAKPIEPEALFAFVEEFLCAPEPVARPAADDLDAFLSEPTPEDAQHAGLMLWRVRGLDALPAAAVFPAPSAVERARLEYCFRLVAPEAADCLVLLRPAGIPDLEAARAAGALQPLFAVDASGNDMADLQFQVGDGESWSDAAASIAGFRERRARLKPDVSKGTFETKLAAYLYVAQRQMVLHRDQFGRTGVANAGGFRCAAVIEAIKALAAQGLVAAKPGASSDESVRELCVSLTPKGVGVVAEASALTMLSVG